jgi:hypothetical protein
MSAFTQCFYCTCTSQWYVQTYGIEKKNAGGRQPDVLQQVTVQIQSNAECTKNYGKDAPGGIVDHMICAAYPGKDSCSVRMIHYYQDCTTSYNN